MKKVYLFFLLIAVAFSTVFSQVPNAFNYQAVVRNSSGEILVNKTVSFRISLLKNSETGTVAYSETHSLSTNEFGLVNFKIGKGIKISGTFSPSDWGEVIFTKVEFDPAGGSSFSHLATTKLSSVPFAFVAQTVVNDKVDDADADPANEIQTITKRGSTLTLSKGGGSVTLPSTGGDDDWGTQTVSTNATLTGDGTSAHPLSVTDDLNVNDLTANGDVFINQNLEVADDMTVGSVTISAGELTKSTTGASNNLLPFAYGTISDSGGKIGCTSNVGTVTRHSDGQYSVHITNLGTDYTVVITPYGLSAYITGAVVRYTDFFNGLIWDTKNDKYYDGGFSFIIYKP